MTAETPDTVPELKIFLSKKSEEDCTLAPGAVMAVVNSLAMPIKVIVDNPYTEVGGSIHWDSTMTDGKVNINPGASLSLDWPAGADGFIGNTGPSAFGVIFRREETGEPVKSPPREPARGKHKTPG